MRAKAIVWIVLAAIIGVASGMWVGGVWRSPIRPAQPESAQALIGKPTADFALLDMRGQIRVLSEWRGKPLVLNFWATWCPPCVEEMPVLESFSHSQTELQIVGIALDDKASVERFLQKIPVSYPILLDQNSRTDSSVKLGNALGVLPYTVVIDAQGVLQEQFVGKIDEKQLKVWAERYAAVPKSTVQ